MGKRGGPSNMRVHDNCLVIETTVYRKRYYTFFIFHIRLCILNAGHVFMVLKRWDLDKKFY